VIDPARVHDFQLKGVGDAGSCNLNVTCNSALLNTESRAEAQMSFASDGKQYVCTGTLMNDAKNSGTPYFLTANHCLSTQAVASTLQTRWFFRAASCGSANSMYSGARQLSGGARMLYASANTDTAFMQLNEQPPAGVRYAGSYFGGVVGLETEVTGVHNPRGDLQKYSIGTVKAYARQVQTSQGTALQTSATPQNFLAVVWSQGTTEGGSSGSGLFRTIGSTRYVVGQLFGGDASCTNREGGDAYGRFDLAYSAALSRWLNP
jgi:endoproteinase arg-C